MDFRLSEAQLLLQKTVKDFTGREIEPIADQMDRQKELPDDLIKKMARVDLLGMNLPVSYGGSGSSILDIVLAIEQMSYSGTGAWWLIAFTSSIPECVVQFGTDEQKERYLPPVCRGEVYPSIQFTEENTGSDIKSLITTAKPEGDQYRINGMKRFITFGARKGFAILYAIDENEKCTAFLVEKGIKGYSTGTIYELMGSGGAEAVDVFLDDVQLGGNTILGGKGKGLNVLQRWIADEKIQQAAACVGIAQAALDEAKTYSKNRKVKNRPQSSLKNIGAMLAEMYATLEAARWLTYRTAFLRDQNSPNWIVEAAALKVFVVPAAMGVVEMSRRIHGAYGYTKEYKIERLYRAIAGASAIAVSLEMNKSIVSASMMR